jgi:Sulfotransferase domain
VVAPATPARPALVISHERSGTHFLMNTLALNFGYRPFVDLDERPDFNPRSTPQLLAFLLAGWPPQMVLKSHHPADLLPPLALLAEVFEVFYVLRDPRDVLLSFWRYVSAVNASGLDGGPQVATLGEFLRAAPAGSMLRYQRRPASTMVERWRLHVEGWTAAAERLPGRLKLVRYDDLDERFAATVARLADALGCSVGEARRPSHHENVVLAGPGGSGRHRALLTAEDQAFVGATAGETMRRVGFTPG